jgi:hypothetical protein
MRISSKKVVHYFYLVPISLGTANLYHEWHSDAIVEVNLERIIFLICITKNTTATIYRSFAKKHTMIPNFIFLIAFQ